MTLDDDRAFDIDYWRNHLNAIDRMLTEIITEQHITITSYAMDLTGPSVATEPPLPGGDRTVITGPWARDAAYGDDTPHPRQTIVEWCERLRDHRHQPIGHPRFAEALRYLRDQTPWILESPFSLVWREDITAVHGRLRALCPPEVDEHHDSTRDQGEQPRTLTGIGEELPDRARLTLAQLDRAYPGLNLSQRIRSARSKESRKATKENREVRHPFNPDRWNRYRLGDVRDHYPDTRMKYCSTG